MTYLRRALKYFVQITVILTLILLVLMATGMVSRDISVAFRDGWNSVWCILGAFAAMSLVYPLFGYQKRRIDFAGDPAEVRDDIVEALHARGYVLEGGQDGAMRFHLLSPVNRLARLWEDTITLTPVLGGFEAEGLSRDLVRVVSSIEQKIRHYGNE